MPSLLSSLRSWLRIALVHVRHKWDTIVYSGLPLFFWIQPHWTLEQTPDQTGKIVIVTGGNSGTGYATSKFLYEKGATVYLACRDTKKGLEAIDAIKRGGVTTILGMTFPSQNGRLQKHAQLYCLSLDLADLNSVRQFALEFQKRETRLDVLFANAGVMASPEGLFTKQGYSLQFGTNCLGHQQLIAHLLPILLRASQTSLTAPLPRVILTSSAGHSAAPRNGFNPRSVVRDSKTASETRQRGKHEYMKWIEYGQSKWGDVALSRWLHWVYGPEEGRKKEALTADRAGEGSLISISVHPGLVATNLAQHLALTPYVIRWAPWLAPVITKTPAEGAINQIWAATCPDHDARKLSGEYIVPFQRIGNARNDLDDLEKVQAVWDWCEAQGRRSA